MKNTPAVLKSLAFTVLAMVALCALVEYGVHDYQERAKEQSVLKERAKERQAIISSVLKERTKERQAIISSVLKERTKERLNFLKHATAVL